MSENSSVIPLCSDIIWLDTDLTDTNNYIDDDNYINDDNYVVDDNDHDDKIR